MPTSKMKKQTWCTKPQVFFASWGASWSPSPAHLQQKWKQKKTRGAKLGFLYFLRQKVWLSALHTHNKNERKTWSTKPRVFFDSQGKRQGRMSHTPIGKMKIKNLGCQALGFLHFLTLKV
jgi:hypothetical protein